MGFIFDYNKLVASQTKLDNNISVYRFEDEKIGLTRIEFLFSAGSFFQAKTMVAGSCCALISEGTENYTAEELSEKLDFYGAFIEKAADRDDSSIVIYCLPQYIKDILPICEEMLKRAVFPQKELEVYLDKSYNRFQISLQKVSEISRREFYKALYGDNHPYGTLIGESDFKNISREDIIEFYKKYYVAENCKIVLAGTIGSDIHKDLNFYFGGNDWSGEKACIPSSIDLVLPKGDIYRIKKEGTVQSSLRIGRPTLGPNDTEFFDFSILDYVFGGYFGSRIMKNIREEHAYTYGISSYLIPMRFSTAWMINSEVKQGCEDEVISEIHKEMDILINKQISAKELQLVKNCYLGEFLRDMDGIFDISERFKFLQMFDLDENYYKNFISRLNTISAEEIQQYAIKYFSNKEDLNYIIVGA